MRWLGLLSLEGPGCSRRYTHNTWETVRRSIVADVLFNGPPFAYLSWSLESCLGALPAEAGGGRCSTPVSLFLRCLEYQFQSCMKHTARVPGGTLLSCSGAVQHGGGLFVSFASGHLGVGQYAGRCCQCRRVHIWKQQTLSSDQ